jgi:hypothetical protein
MHEQVNEIAGAQLDVVAHIYNPSYSGSKDWEDQGQPRQKARSHLNKQAGCGDHAHDLRYADDSR